MATNPGQTNLNSWWALDETSGTRYDAHGSADLTDNNSCGYSTGKQSNAANLVGGSAETLTRTDDATVDFSSGVFTLSGWIRPTTIDSTTRRVLTKYQSTASEREFLIQIGTDNKIIIAVYNSSGSGVSAKWGTALSADTWYHIFAYCDQNNDVIGISVNGGTPVETSWTGTNNPSGTATLMFGNYDGAGSGYFDGDIDEWCWYGRKLSTDERDWLYNSGSGRAYSETVESVSVTPTAAAVTPTANAPSLTLGAVSVTPTTAAATPTANVPTAATAAESIDVTPGAAAATPTANAPSLTLGATSLTPDAAAASPTANAPDVDSGAAPPTNPGRTDLVAWWALDETSGTRYDSHGTRDLTDHNTSGYKTGQQGNAASFLVVNSEGLSVVDDSGMDFGSKSWTFSGWVYLSASSGNMHFVTKYKSSPTTDREFRIMAVAGSGTFNFYVHHSGGGSESVALSGLSTGTWFHITAWYDRPNNAIGLSVDNGTPNTLSLTGGAIQDGGAMLVLSGFDFGSSNIGGGITGYMDEWCWYDRVLTDGERTWLYNDGAGRPYSETDTSANVEADPAALTVTSNAPSLTLGAVTLTPSALSAALTALAPSLAMGGITLEALAAALAATASAPSLTLGSVSLTPSVAGIVLSAIAPTLALGGVALTPDAAGIVLSALAPSLTMGAATATPAAAALAVVALDATPTGGPVTVTVDVADLSPTALDALAQPGAIVVVVGPENVSPTALDASGEPGEVQLTPDAAEMTVVVLDPDVFGGIVSEVVALVVTALAPELVMGETVITAGVVELVVVAEDPAVEVGETILTPGTAAITLVAVDPSGTLEQTVNLLLARTRQAAALVDPRPRHPAIALSTWLALPTYPTGQVAAASIPWTVPAIGPAALVAARPEPARIGLAQPDPGVLPSPAAAAAVESRAGQPAAVAAEIDWE